MLTACSIWRERNVIIFEGTYNPIQQIIDKVKYEQGSGLLQVGVVFFYLRTGLSFCRLLGAMFPIFSFFFLGSLLFYLVDF
jgi:hypothetical protein